jgi:chaperonin GroEL
MVTNPEQMVVEYEDAFLLLVDGRIVDGNKLANVLEIIAKTKGNVPVIVIAEDVVDSALTLLVVNKLKKGFYWAAVKSPGFGERKREVMKDLAIMTGGTFITPEADLSLEKATIEHLGFAKRIKITKDSTTILEGAGKPEEIENRKKEIQIQIDGSNSEYDKGMLQERLAKLSSGVAVVKAGAPTEVEMKQAKARIEDAVNAVKAAIAEGVVPGGGSALLRAGKDLDKLPVETNEDIQHGIDVIRRAIQEPLRRIVSNGGLSADVITNNVLSNPKKTPNYGYNAATNTYGDLVSMGVIDPTKVTRVALENAASIAKMILTTSGTLVDEPDPTKRDMPSYDGDY